MLRVIIPYTKRHPETESGAPPNAEWCDVAADGQAYFRLMRNVWRECAATGYDLLVVEHDVVCRPDVIEQFEECPEPWCAFPYEDMCHWECMEAWANTLGCTRFSADLIAQVPDAVSSITRLDHLDWHNLCDGIGDNLRGAVDGDGEQLGYWQHWHFPPVRHHHMGRPQDTGAVLATVRPA